MGGSGVAGARSLAQREGADDGDKELPAFIVLAYLTGARRRSITGLERRQVKWDRELIHLQKPEKRPTKKGQPIVPILTDMRPTLEWLWERSKGRERLFSDTDVYWRYRRLCEALGFVDRSHPHLLRQAGVVPAATWEVELCRCKTAWGFRSDHRTGVRPPQPRGRRFTD